MAQVLLGIPDETVRRIQARVGYAIQPEDIAVDAFTLFCRAVDEQSNGRLILSSDENGRDMVALDMPALEKAAPIRRFA